MGILNIISSKHQGISAIFTTGKTSQHHYKWGKLPQKEAAPSHHFKSLVQPCTGIFIRNYATILEHIHAHPSSEGVT